MGYGKHGVYEVWVVGAQELERGRPSGLGRRLVLDRATGSPKDLGMMHLGP